MSRQKVSAFVVSYNREDTIGTCLKALGFVDELILVDKSSTDRTVEIAKPLVDRLVVVPWTPTADDTREYAQSLCTHDWIVFLDDDECLNSAAIQFIVDELEAPRAAYYFIPLRHYIIGIHDESAYYWPEHHVRFYKKGALRFTATTHNMIRYLTQDSYRIPADAGPSIHHLSHKNTYQWIEKSNRYTSQADRSRMVNDEPGNDVVVYAHHAIDHWVRLSRNVEPGSYVATIAVLRATYDIIDRLKIWEEEHGIDGTVLFAQTCQMIEAEIAATVGALMQKRAGAQIETSGATTSTVVAEPVLSVDVLSRQAAAIKSRHDALEKQFLINQRELETLKATRSWRMTRPLRDLGHTLNRWFGIQNGP